MASSPAAAGGAGFRPVNTLRRRRFIAWHMTMVRIEPEAATVAPQAMRSRFSMTTPTRAAAKPAVAFRKEMSTGMSAPPMRTANTTPRATDRTPITMRSRCTGRPAPAATATRRPEGEDRQAGEHGVVVAEDQRGPFEAACQLAGGHHAGAEGGRADEQPEQARDPCRSSAVPRGHGRFRRRKRGRRPPRRSRAGGRPWPGSAPCPPGGRRPSRSGPPRRKRRRPGRRPRSGRATGPRRSRRPGPGPRSGCPAGRPGARGTARCRR